jgi:glutamate dehydrogenase/leucine dehydrogenase
MTGLRLPWPSDPQGPSAVIIFQLPSGCIGIVAVDNLTLGPAIGGLRLDPAVTPAEVVRLARAMTLKSAAAGLPHGGAKAGIRTPGPLDPLTREGVIRAFAQAIRHLTEYIPGPDMGTDETAMAWVHDEIGRAVGLPALLGGIPLDEIGATGYGLAVCADALAAAGRLELAGCRVAIQGFGAVGRHAARFLAERGAIVVAVSDVTGAVYDPHGLDVAALTVFNRTNPLVDYPDAKQLDRDELLTVDCDLLIPAARPDALHEGNAPQVKARVIIQGANIPATAAAEEILQARGVLNIPDFVANAGGVICAATELHGGDRARALSDIAERITANTTELLDRVATTGWPPRVAAEAMARVRLETAGAYHRHF